jgi:hypothetical protein
VEFVLGSLVGDETRRSGRIAIFAASSLEGVETETDVGPVDELHDFPDFFPSGRHGCPAPVVWFG